MVKAQPHQLRLGLGLGLAFTVTMNIKCLESFFLSQIQEKDLHNFENGGMESSKHQSTLPSLVVILNIYK